MKGQTLRTVLDAFEARSDQTAFVQIENFRTIRWSYKQLAETSYRFARQFEEWGIGPGDRVLLCARNRPEWVATFFGLVLRAAIVVPIDVQSAPAFAEKVQQQVGAKLAICDSETRSQIPLNIRTLAVEELVQSTARHSSAPYTAVIGAPAEIVEVLFTSGTTAEPKGVCITHQNLLTNLRAIHDEIVPLAKWAKFLRPIKFLSLVPLSHVFGQLMGMLVPELIGGEVSFQERSNTTQIVQSVRRERISVVITVPRVLQLLREKLERTYDERGKLAEFKAALEKSERKHFLFRWWKFRHIHRLFGWRCWAFISGGATLTPDTETFWRRLGFAVIQGYGMTETAGLIAVNNPLRQKKHSVGRALASEQLKLTNQGEVLVRGENVSPGYWGEASNPTESDWLHTGDIADIDAEGNLYLKGRSREVIVTAGGLNVHHQDIERVLNVQPEVKESIVIEAKTHSGPEPLAVIILRNKRADVEQLIGRANKALAEHQKVRRWVIWPDEDFPRTATQKIRKREVSETVNAQSIPERANSTVREKDALTALIAGLSNEDPLRITASAKLGADLQLDSLARVELLGALEDRYDIQIDEAAFTASTTVADIKELVRQRPLSRELQYPYPRWQQQWPVNWLRTALLYSIVLPLVRLLGRPTVIGREHLEHLQMPVVIVSNHVTMVDHALILSALPNTIRKRTAIAQDGELLRSWRYPAKDIGTLRTVMTKVVYFLVVLFFNVFSMPQKSGFRKAFAFAGKIIDRGHSLLVFPEGERTKHGEMNPFRLGTGLLVHELNVPVVPIRIDGLWQLKQQKRHIGYSGDIAVVIGEPVRYSQEQDPQSIARDLWQRVNRLLKP